MENEKNKIATYQSYLFTLLITVVLTLAAVALASAKLGIYSVVGSLVLAIAICGIVVFKFMNFNMSKHANKLLGGLVLFVFALVILISFFDYLSR